MKEILIYSVETGKRKELYMSLADKYKIFTSISKDEVLSVLKHQNIDLVILDPMPVDDLLGCVKEIKGIRPGLRLLAFAREEQLPEMESVARESGDFGVLRFSIGTDKLVALIRDFLGAAEKKGPLPRKIMIVDDEPEIRSLLKEFLQRKGFEAFPEPNGEAAVKDLPSVKPSVVLLDVKMPGMGGIETLRKIKEFDRSIAVIMITGVGDEETGRQAMRLGAFDFMLKPLNLHYLDTCLMLNIFLVGK